MKEEKNIFDVEDAYMDRLEHGKGGKKLLKAVLALSLAGTTFLGGAMTAWFCLDEEMRLLIKAKNTIDRQYYEDLDDKTFYDGLFDAVNEQLDEYSYYMPAEVYETSADNLNGKRIGFGVAFQSNVLKLGKVQVKRVCGNSPAEEAGLRSGDFIVGFGRSESEMTTLEKYEDFTAFLTEIEETPFFIRIKRGEEELTVPIAQREYVENYVFYRSKTTAYGYVGKNADQLAQRGQPLSILPEDTAYIRLLKFGNNSVKLFKGAMSLFKQENKKHLVLDLRGNGGGYMNVMQGIAAYFCKNATAPFPVAAIADYGERRENYLASGNEYNNYFDMDSKIYVLADSGSASASECLLGVMIEYGATMYEDICLFERNGVAKTYGKGIMQAHFPLSAAGDIMKLTTAKVCWPVTGQSIHGRGILPEDGAKTVPGGLEEEELCSALSVLFPSNV